MQKLLAIVAILFFGSHCALAEDPIKPEDVIAGLHQSMRETLNFGDDFQQKHWLSLTTVGSSATAQSVVDSIGDFVPPCSPYLQSFQYGRKLHLRYLDIINSTLGPELEYSSQYSKAKSKIYQDAEGTKQTPKYIIYREYELKYRALKTKLIVTTNPDEKALIAIEMRHLDDDWRDLGHREEIDAALSVISAEDSAMGGTQKRRRVSLVNDFLGTKLSPTSQLVPSPAEWSTSTAWAAFKYSQDTTVKKSEYNEQIKKMGGGFSLGFVTLGASGRSGTTTTKNFTKIYKLSYSYEIMKVEIDRPWFERSVFFEGKSFTWGSDPSAGSAEYPLIADNVNSPGIPRLPSSPLFKEKEISCPLIPVTLVVARNMTVVATISKADWSDVLNKGKVTGGGSLFGIFGGGGGSSWTTNKRSEDNETVTFEISMAGPAIVGVISIIVPKCPDPNTDLKWPEGVWLPKK